MLSYPEYVIDGPSDSDKWTYSGDFKLLRMTNSGAFTLVYVDKAVVTDQVDGISYGGMKIYKTSDGESRVILSQ